MSQATLSTGPYNSNLFSSHYLDEHVYGLDEWDCDADAEAAFEELRSLWEAERDLVDSYKEDELLDSWIGEVLDVLGFDTLSETTLPDGGGYNDRLLFSSRETRREAAFEKKDGRHEAMYDLASALLEAKRWNASFEDRFSEDRSYRDASHQVKYYLERTPEKLQWGVLTNGRKWRLYGTKDYETQTYYEVDLPELLESGSVEAFKYFFVFFRPDAFEASGGTTFLDTVWNESETAAQELGEDLQNNVFTALRVLGKGFVETNDLDIDPDDDERLDELKEQSLVLLYRLMFTLYAESRNLINPEDPVRREEYEQHFSLDELRLDILDTVGEGAAESGFNSYSTFSTSMWGRLEDLFSLVDSGEESLGIPPYNGGLFDEDRHTFLTENEVSDRHLAEVIYRLSTTETDDGFVPADYADLDTRHLGTIYEGLLEHEFRIAPTQYAAVSEDGGQVWKDAAEVSVADAVETVDAGGLYVVNDDGERKATGAYYTPDYVVTYIVEETVDPLLEDIESDLGDRGLERGTQEYVFRFADEVLDLKVLDPAMGSGHFLTKATGYLAEQVMERVRELETATAFDEQQIRREISRECIYGVDLNGMAVELAKLSMWLETLATDQPLAFLDHHLKAGNSLVGSDITDVLADDDDAEGGQLTFAQVFSHARQRTLEHVMELVEDLLAIDNESYEDVKSMEETYAEIRADPLYQRLFEMANVHTAERFGVEVPDDAYERMAEAIEDEDEWLSVAESEWFVSAQETAQREQFFHWELEFPEVFFSESGEKSEEAGFDAVVGNPPYVPTEQIPTVHKKYLTSQFQTLYRKYDLSVAFLEQCFDLSRKKGFVGMITPVAWETGENYSKFRESRIASKDAALMQIVNLPFDVFADAYVDTNIAIFSPQRFSTTTICAKEIDKKTRITDAESLRNGFEAISYEQLASADGAKIYFDSAHYDLLETYESTDFCEFGDITEGRQGIVASFYDYSSTKESEGHLLYRECDVYRYSLSVSEERYIDFSDEPNLKRFYTQPRILLRRLVNRDDRLMAAYEEDEYVVKKDLNPFIISETDLSLKYLLSCLNSSLLSYIYVSSSALAQKDDFRQTTLSEIQSLPIRVLTVDEHADDSTLTRLKQLGEQPNSAQSDVAEVIGGLLGTSEGETAIHNFLCESVDDLHNLHSRLRDYNLSLPDYLGSYQDSQTLSEIGFQQPIADTAKETFNDTTEEKEKLGVTEVTFTRENPTTLTVDVGVRYKPENPDDYETDTYGYHYVDPKPAFRITDLTETEADLIEAFVPHAVEEAGGYANFRANATKTNSPLDRLKKLTLPTVDDVRDGLENYVETVERAEELEEQIERTDDLIDDIVYELYGLTDEEIEIVEESVKG
ncbi:Eco57I restriction-modification methylase domain-containing protein [Halogeometricum luteum]|uniref:site-specific DNA-methyltransferase (adenine-specific) n=1 Tax=Halogeometricum luteum TaxID=2950537 RepID=A0ABU2FYN2_9EURY|nr:TaqI-like C-terminal specificity domain-containing protein [Halogeometricum sp. S3BR5-2]MDS0293635.1 N-6 DNA methylase [Halogeometricum sp. S3BR5-2]